MSENRLSELERCARAEIGKATIGEGWVAPEEILWLIETVREKSNQAETFRAEVEHFKGAAKEHAENLTETQNRLDAIGRLIEDNGCNCDCDHDSESHDAECLPWRCLACHVGTALEGKTLGADE